MISFSGFSATLVVLTSAAITPAHKGLVSVVALVVGSAFATYLLVALSSHVWKEFISDFTFGALACYSVLRRYPVNDAGQ